MDIVSKEKRAAMMRAVRRKDTGPEMLLRRALHRAGFRFRLHYRNLPGTPDIVLPSRRTVIFVHGCFWHRHHGCSRTTTPATRTEFWTTKFRGNIRRDRRVQKALKKLGWRVIVVWECEVRTLRAARLLVARFSRKLRKKTRARKKTQVNRV